MNKLKLAAVTVSGIWLVQPSGATTTTPNCGVYPTEVSCISFTADPNNNGLIPGNSCVWDGDNDPMCAPRTHNCTQYANKASCGGDAECIYVPSTSTTVPSSCTINRAYCPTFTTQSACNDQGINCAWSSNACIPSS